MENKVFERKHKEDKPVLAICYDFDKTLSPDDMQAQGYIQSVGRDVNDFWKESNALAENNDMDQNLAYMLKMMREAEGNVILKKEALNAYGEKISLFSGVDTWFERIKKYGEKRGVIVEHYIISSGLKEMIEGTSVAKAGAFEKVYASSFYYNERGVAVWPAQVVNYTNKTQFLFRIEKGVLDINDPGVNDFFAPDEIRVPFRNIVYIGDSDTDVPCMKLVNSYGGHAIGVYNAKTADKTKVYKMMRDNRIKYFAPSDYSEGGELDGLVKAIVDRTATNENLEKLHFKYKRECDESGKLESDEDKEKKNCILALEESSNFASTHMAIRELEKFSNKFTAEDRRALLKTGAENSQVYCILNDADVKDFYTKLLKDYTSADENASRIKNKLER